MRKKGQTTKKVMAVLATALAAMGTTACLMGQNFVKPDMPVPAAFRGAPSTEESIASLPWWDVLKDGNLRSLLEDTYRNNIGRCILVGLSYNFGKWNFKEKNRMKTMEKNYNL